MTLQFREQMYDLRDVDGLINFLAYWKKKITEIKIKNKIKKGVHEEKRLVQYFDLMAKPAQP